MPILKHPKFPIPFFVPRLLTILLILTIGTGVVLGIRFYQENQSKNSLSKQLQLTQKELTALKNVDQYKRNNELEATMSAIQKTFTQTITTYQDLLDLKQNVKDSSQYDTLFAQILKYLSDKNYSSAAASLVLLNQQIAAQQAKISAASVPSVPQNAPANNAAPGNGYSRQSVSTPNGNFVVDIIAGDLGSTRVVVDTASGSDCSNNCPTLPLSDYVSRSGAYAGIDGNFFCPAEYPSCAGKTGSFDLLVMNKNKVYFNSSNNVYSTNPVVVFGSGFVRFIGAAENWGRDTSVDGVLSNYPLLVSGGNVVFSGSDDPKFGSKGPRGFVANKGNTVFIGYVYNANMSDSAAVMKALGMENAMNLDEGGSTALMFNGSYLAGPGRNIPDAILFLHK